MRDKSKRQKHHLAEWLTLSLFLVPYFLCVAALFWGMCSNLGYVWNPEIEPPTFGYLFWIGAAVMLLATLAAAVTALIQIGILLCRGVKIGIKRRREKLKRDLLRRNALSR